MSRMKSSVMRARPDSPSLRTTIPVAAAEFLELSAGQELQWTPDIIDGQKILKVRALPAGTKDKKKE